MAEEGTGGRGRGERGGQRKGPEMEGEGRKREGPNDPLAYGPQCLNPSLHTQWRRKRHGRYGGRHANLKFGMAAQYQSAEIGTVEFQENHYNCCHQMSDLKAKMH